VKIKPGELYGVAMLAVASRVFRRHKKGMRGNPRTEFLVRTISGCLITART
jgi:hypothetical protein